MGCERAIREMDGCGFGVNLMLWYRSHVAALVSRSLLYISGRFSCSLTPDHPVSPVETNAKQASRNVSVHALPLKPHSFFILNSMKTPHDMSA